MTNNTFCYLLSPLFFLLQLKFATFLFFYTRLSLFYYCYLSISLIFYCPPGHVNQSHVNYNVLIGSDWALLFK